MTTIGGEYFSISFSLLITMLVSAVLFLGVWLGSRETGNFYHLDSRAGDEGED